MGAAEFFTEARGRTAQEAFTKAVQQALLDHGNGGYTGTIAEKHEFVVISVPAGTNPREFARTLIDTDEDPRVVDKWGPAGCVALGNGRWLFFGLASS